MPSLFSSPKIPAPAEVKPPTVMPVQDDAAVQAAKAKRAAVASQGSGRASTIFNQPAGADKLGG